MLMAVLSYVLDCYPFPPKSTYSDPYDDLHLVQLHEEMKLSVLISLQTTKHILNHADVLRKI